MNALNNLKLGFYPKINRWGIFLGVSILFLSNCTVKENDKIPFATHVYFGMKPLPNPQLVAPGNISTSLNEYNGTFSPDGTEFYYTAEIPGLSIVAYTKMDSLGLWSKPSVASFSGSHTDYDPLFAPDGNRLYFSSERPTDDLDSIHNTNIWYVERNNNQWGPPHFISLSNKGDYFSSLTHSGDIYFNIWSTGNILKASKTDTGYVYKDLPESINGGRDVGDPFISPEEDYLIFRGYFEDSYGLGDLYISFKDDDGWSPPVNLGEPINSRAHEMTPYVTVDGRYFIFSSSRKVSAYDTRKGGDLEEVHRQFQTLDNGRQNIYIMSADFIERFRNPS